MSLMVRRRFFSAVSNHESPCPSFETPRERRAAPQDEEWSYAPSTFFCILLP